MLDVHGRRRRSADPGGDDGGTFRVSLTSGRAAQRRDKGKGRAGGGEGPSDLGRAHARGGHGALPRSSAACHATTHSLIGQIRMAGRLAGWHARRCDGQQRGGCEAWHGRMMVLDG